jgi:hypothetical protein
MNRIKQIIQQQPSNYWAIYHACRALGEQLLPLPYIERVALLRKEFPSATRQAVAEGLAEFESVIKRDAV